jgi:predicted peroxiredoxin
LAISRKKPRRQTIFAISLGFKDMDFRVAITAIFLACSLAAHGQSSKKKKKSAPDVNIEQPTSLNPSKPEQRDRVYAPKKSRKNATRNPEQEFYERMEAVVKAKRKAEKLMMKPQYSDPMYFGHKRPPKKRPPHKMKYCKECGIRH